ncbi:MAG: malate synthase, partial [Sulfitobacter sp.]
MTDRINKAGLQVAPELVRFIEGQALPGTGVDTQAFWDGFATVVAEIQPRVNAALAERTRMQAEIDAWHIARRGQAHDASAYEAFLHEIGYLVPQGSSFPIETQNVDPEIAQIAGPQLVVPVMNARFALNAANARWGSFYDALYGTDALGDLPEGKGFDAARGARVVARAKAFLDEAVPLDHGTWASVVELGLAGNELAMANGDTAVALKDPAQFKGHAYDGDVLRLMFENNDLKIEVVVDAQNQIGRSDPAGMADVRLESALSVIMDCEDSVAAVDAEDKVVAYSNWLGLMKGDLEEAVQKGGNTVMRRLNPDLSYTAPDGSKVTTKGRALMLVRNVGHLMTTPAVLDANGAEIGEGILDGLITVLAAMHDLKRRANSAVGSVYVVKPKMHGPAEVALSNDLFTAIEEALGLAHYTVKLGIMDEERRTSANLSECIRAAKHRVAFINTGFLDRTGDEIHTSMEAGPMLPKGDMKGQPWISAYEDRNVDIGLACGLRGK